MHKLSLLVILLFISHVCLAGGKDSCAQNHIDIKMDVKGKISDVNGCCFGKKGNYTIVIEQTDSILFKAKEIKDVDAEALKNNMPLMLKSGNPLTSDLSSDINTSIANYNKLNYRENVLKIINKKTGTAIDSFNGAPGDFDHEDDIDEDMVLTVKKADLQNRALYKYYNSFGSTQKVADEIDKLIEVEENIWKFKDEVYEYFLIGNGDTTHFRSSYNDIHKKLSAIDEDVLKKWLLYWVGTTNSWNVNPLGMTDKKNIPAFSDTNRLINEIADIEQLMHNMHEYSQHYYYLKQKKASHSLHLDKIRFYASAIQHSDKAKADFNHYTTIADIELKTAYDYLRIHDASQSLKLVNKETTDKHEYTTDDKVGVMVYNIPYNVKFDLTYTSKGFVTQLQATKFFDNVATQTSTLMDDFKGLKNYSIESWTDISAGKKADTQMDGTVKRMFNTIESLHQRISVYTSNLPPAVKLKYADDKDGGYKMKMNIIESKDSDSSYNHTYVMESGSADDKNGYKKEEITIKSYKKSRFQFVSGAHFFTGSAPIVEKKDGIYTISSSNTIRYSVGLKTYFKRQSFTDINFKKISGSNYAKRLFGSAHVILSADVQKPLENLYMGFGLDIVPGLGVNCGAHLYKYTKYQLFNGVEVGHSSSYQLRNGVYIAATMDGSVLSKIFLSIFKLN